MSNDILDTFLSDLDAIDDYCDEQKEKLGYPNCCKGCILNDYCLDIPTRSHFEAGIKTANKAVDLIRKTKEGEGYKKITIGDAQIDGERACVK